VPEWLLSSTQLPDTNVIAPRDIDGIVMPGQQLSSTPTTRSTNCGYGSLFYLI